MKKYCCVLLFLFSLFALRTSAQQGFQNLYGGHNQDKGFISVSAFDGIYLLGATTSSGIGLSDLALLNVDYSGSVNWAKTYGGAYDEAPGGMVGSGDGGLVVVGNTRSYNGNQNTQVLIFKTNSYGNIVWQKLVPAPERTEPAAVIRTSDGGFAVTGLSVVNGFMHVLLIRTDAVGDTLFTSLYGSDIANDLGVGLAQTPDGGFVIAGKTLTNSGGLADLMLIKTDASGNMTWAKAFGFGAWEEGEAITITHDANYLVCGSTTSNGQGSYDVLLWKCDTAGNSIWGKTYGGDKPDASYCVHENGDGTIAVAGYTNSWGYGHTQDPNPIERGDDSTNIFLMKTSSTGDLIWAESYGDNKQDEAFQFSLTPGGGYIVPGFSNSYTNATDSMQMLLIQTDSMGYSGCHEQRVYPVVGPVSYTPRTLPFIQTRGMAVNNSNLTTLPWSVGADDACVYIGISSPSAADESDLSLFPNPTINHFTLQTSMHNGYVEIFNSLGEKVYAGELNSETIYLDQPAGIYFVRVLSGSKVFVQKLMIE
jgi:hypothetical protein